MDGFGGAGTAVIGCLVWHVGVPFHKSGDMVSKMQAIYRTPYDGK